MSDVSPANTSSRDFGFIAIAGLVFAIAIWLLLMPLVPQIAMASMRRFHLRYESFALWAIQQPIPSMYNFANQVEVREAPDEANVPTYVNHFPPRAVTFANRRYRYLQEGTDRWFIFRSSYRGQTIRSDFHARAKGDGGFELIRLPTGSLATETSR